MLTNSSIVLWICTCSFFIILIIERSLRNINLFENFSHVLLKTIKDSFIPGVCLSFPPFSFSPFSFSPSLLDKTSVKASERMIQSFLHFDCWISFTISSICQEWGVSVQMNEPHAGGGGLKPGGIRTGWAITTTSSQPVKRPQGNQCFNRKQFVLASSGKEFRLQKNWPILCKIKHHPGSVNQVTVSEFVADK